MTPMQARQLLLVDDGLESGAGRALSRAVARGTHLRLRRGVMVETAIWRVLTKEERLLLRIVALDLTSRSRPVFTHWSAAALLGLPIARRAAELVDIGVEGRRNRTVVGARVHLLALDAAEVIEVDGLLCTTLARTAIDIAADGGFEEAVVVADVVLVRLGPDARTKLLDAVDLAERRRGSVKVERVLEFADPRSGSPGESISRVRMHRLGFIAPELQVAIETNGRLEFADFGWLEVGGAGEFDGELKYRGARYRAGRSIEDVVIDEKNRENRIRRRRPRFARWDWADLTSGRLEGILGQAGIPKRDDRARRRPSPPPRADDRAPPDDDSPVR